MENERMGVENPDELSKDDLNLIEKHFHIGMNWKNRTIWIHGLMGWVVALVSNIVIVMGLACVAMFATWGIAFALKMFLLTIGAL
jgi:hypothetical protein